MRRFVWSLLFGGGAFASLMAISAQLAMLRGQNAVGPFLVFYSAVYVLGQVASLAGYQRGPFLVARNLDVTGQFGLRAQVEAVLWSAVLLGAAIASAFGGSWIALSAAGAILVGVQFVVSGLANGLGRFVTARLNFVILPNVVFILALPFVRTDPMQLYCLCLAAGGGLGLVALRLAGWRRLSPVSSAMAGAKLVDAVAIAVTILISSISQIDLWIVGALVQEPELSRYAFASRMTMVLTFPVIAYINSIQPVLAGFAAAGDESAVQRLFGTAYRPVKIMVVMLGLAAPVFAGVWGMMVFGVFDWRVALIAAAVSVGYGLSALVPPFEALSYARGHEGQYLAPVAFGIALQCVLGIGLIATGSFYLLPVVSGAVLAAIRWQMRRELRHSAG